MLLLAVSAPQASAAGLDIGDLAPPLSILEWVKGRPIDLKRDASKRIHVVEFWAVWCPPCKMSVPLLTQLQKKYGKDVVIVGVTEPDMRGNSPSAIRRFTKDQGANMDYSVAIDDGRTTQAYLASAGVIGIPHAFVVNKDRRIVWQGSPLDPALDDVLGRVVAGTFDIKAAKLEREVNKRLQELDLLSQLGQWAIVWDGLLDILKLDPANEFAMEVLMRISVDELENLEDFRKWARMHIAAHSDSARAMHRLANMLCNIGDMTSRCPDIALEAALASYKASKRREAAAIAAYARALYQIGELDRAIALQQDAVAVADGLERDAGRTILDYYRRCKKLQGTVK
jgi:thiol-disulfide isomerase/thioredoxin